MNKLLRPAIGTTRICMILLPFFAMVVMVGCNTSKTDLQPASPSQSYSSASDSAAASAAPVIGNAPASNATKSDREAITEAIQEHLKNNHSINMSAMESSVDHVNVNGDQATAAVSFHLKQGGASMMMNYFLQRHAGGWIVLRSEPSGGQFAHPAMDRTHSGGISTSGAAPSGVPDVTDYLKALPANAGNAKTQP